ncbi:erythromycin esterase family protein [Chitinophagaceae bacterium LB-8]|uniref:Erythromycin esterase family protein n=1 Tax=Paraflavisolibacter caeni TaxID=2982496 RepID=A0A9X2XWP1_9BACT|nr:erythromycin esterase family protein [Paraflavisolibacter caeni]MCU7550270.1 erythromycin esterase family protein [Paraflavisolibacter caeni]
MIFTKTHQDEQQAVQFIKERSIEINQMVDLDVLIESIGNKRIVMLGEATHGTHEYYTWRSYISIQLIERKGFNFIAVEGDWPDCYRINRYIKGKAGTSALEILKTFDRWPTWMWANWEIAALTEWLNNYNKSLQYNQRIGFYGLDVYSLWDSLHAVREYLQKVDPQALTKAEEAFLCFEPYKNDEGTSYAYASKMVPDLCQEEVVGLLQEIRRKLPQYDSDEEVVFSTEQNALIAVNAEKYYRAMINGGPQSWNVRDSHMEETLERLLDFHGPDSKAIVWEHNTHIGDSRATDMTDEGMYNIGELARTRYPEKDVALVGFGSYEGTVIAGSSWGAPMKKMDLPEARDGSWEYLLHLADDSNKLLFMEDFRDTPFFDQRIGHRAVGVVYRPHYESYGNYVPTILPQRYDAFIYIDKSSALHPLHLAPHSHQMPDTYPFGL